MTLEEMNSQIEYFQEVSIIIMIVIMIIMITTVIYAAIVNKIDRKSITINEEILKDVHNQDPRIDHTRKSKLTNLDKRP